MMLPAILLLGSAGLVAGGAFASPPQAQPGRDASAPAVPPSPDRPTDLSADAAGNLLAEGASYRAQFAPGTMHFETRSAAADEQAPSLDLRFVGASRGTSLVVPTVAVAPTQAGDLVRYDRIGFAETYDVRPEGVEQAFHFAARPAGHGDLVLQMDVAGNLTAAAQAPTHGDLTFCRNGTPALRYGAAAAFDREGHATEVLTGYDGQGRLELVVPAAFVDAATFPLVVDPAIGAVVIASTTDHYCEAADTAHAPAADVYACVWQDAIAPNVLGIRLSLVHPDGTLVGGNWISISPSNADQSDPSVAVCEQSGAEAFFVVWRRDQTIVGRLVSLTGAMLSPELPISSPGAGNADRRPCVSGPGRGGPMIVAYERRISTSASANRIIVRPVYWANNLAALGTEEALTNVNTGFVQRPRLGRSCAQRIVAGQTYHANRIVYDQFFTTPAPGDYDVMTCGFEFRLNPPGLVVLYGPAGLNGASQISVNEYGGDVASRASTFTDGDYMEFFTTWLENGQVHGQKQFGLFGVAGPEVTIDAGPNITAASVGAGYCEYNVAYVDATPSTNEVLAARVLADGTVARAHLPVSAAPTQFEDRPSASSRPIPMTMSQLGNKSLVAWQTRPSSTFDTQIHARFVEPILPHASLIGFACPGPLGELPAIGTTGQPTAGNSNFQVKVTNAPANSLAALVIGTTFTGVPIPGAPGCLLFAGLPFLTMLPTLTNAAGSGSVALPIPCAIPNQAALPLQWAIYTPGHNALGWIVSNDLDIQWLDQ